MVPRSRARSVLSDLYIARSGCVPMAKRVPGWDAAAMIGAHRRRANRDRRMQRDKRGGIRGGIGWRGTRQNHANPPFFGLSPVGAGPAGLDDQDGAYLLAVRNRAQSRPNRPIERRHREAWWSASVLSGSLNLARHIRRSFQTRIVP